ncbi:hypothetical protein RND71_042829 [Anisodus tanguticus]|uniref:Uncharacterized protein n=1 Tax=Anisodus tanguticus TaxID=243964 RepID=A0AAE1QUE3_9SOLA|nr:hypothetical protein RND71_042829 [Anisodus tanguticus]
MEQKDGFVAARVEKTLALHTIHTPNFLGLYQNMGFWKESNYGMGVIIGLLDTGINPGHPSFSDDNMPPPPAKWKGNCEFTGNVTCNKKLIDARNFVRGSTNPPFEEGGHGTLTASVAAGNFVDDANVFANANGTDAGMAPLAHIAIASAGNDGPLGATLSNVAPWILTVGTSTHDRKIVATAVLGNGQEYDGELVFHPMDFPHTLLPLVYPGLLNQEAALCSSGSLNSADVKGKIVVCDKGRGHVARLEKGQTVKDAGGTVMILVNLEIDGDSTLADAHVLPATHMGYTAGEKIKAYINTTS